MGPNISLVLPVHNEASRVWSNTLRLRDELAQFGDSFEIIIVENGSLDDTSLIINALCASYSNIRYFSLERPCLGEALKLGIKEALGEKIIYYPIDLSVDLRFIPLSLNLLDECDIVLASKRKGQDKRPLIRRVASMTYHRLVRHLNGVHLSDTTCAKAGWKSILLDLCADFPGDSKVFETELLSEAVKQGIKIREVPVKVVETRNSRERLLLKVENKFVDLLSSRVDAISLLVGWPLLGSGFTLFIVLSIEKLFYPVAGFINPYSFLASILLILAGFQTLSLGLVSRLILQMRREVCRNEYKSNYPNEPPIRYSDEQHNGNRREAQ